jgi:hypothetical protein
MITWFFARFCQSNQPGALGTIWRGSKEDPDTKEIRDRATLRRVADVGARDVIEAMLATQMVATHEAVMECPRRAALSEHSVAAREMGLKYGDRLVRSFAALTPSTTIAARASRARVPTWCGPCSPMAYF